MPAMPEPRPKVMASTQLVRMPMAAAMRRFWVTARISRPKRVRRMTASRAANTTRQKMMITSRLSVMVKPPPSSTEPLIQEGVETSRLLGPKILRTSCCRISEMPQVASRVSSGRP